VTRRCRRAKPTTHSKEDPNVARKTTVPGDQLDRLKQVYTDQRDALVTLAAAEEAVAAAKTNLAAAEQAVKDAEGTADAAYQALVDLMGAKVAAQLTGRRPTSRRTTPSPKPEQQAQPRELEATVG
jgi:outer membrane protein TolC